MPLSFKSEADYNAWAAKHNIRDVSHDVTQKLHARQPHAKPWPIEEVCLWAVLAAVALYYIWEVCL